MAHTFSKKSAASEFDAKKRRVKANRNWINFDRVIMATNNPLVGLASVVGATLLQTKLFLYTSYALSGRLPSDTVPEALFWDTREPYDYLRIDRRQGFDYLIYGGEDRSEERRVGKRCAYRV